MPNNASEGIDVSNDHRIGDEAMTRQTSHSTSVQRSAVECSGDTS